MEDDRLVAEKRAFETAGAKAKWAGSVIKAALGFSGEIPTPSVTFPAERPLSF